MALRLRGLDPLETMEEVAIDGARIANPDWRLPQPLFSALMALQLERRKEYAVLRALGLTRSQVSTLIVIESLTLGAVAALLAMPVGLAMAWVLTAAIQLRAFGWTMPLSFVTEPYVVAALTGTGAALLASLLPAWRSAGQNPAPQLRED